MRLYLMRHGMAADPGGIADAMRPLAEQGRQEAMEAGAALRERGEKIEVVLTSPRLRARETAELVAGALGRKVPVVVREGLTCGATASVYLEEIGTRSAGELLLVAHNPELSAFASGLVGESISFRPATICAVDLDADSAHLAWLRHP
jgi:phosphohistidine phosphatase